MSVWVFLSHPRPATVEQSAFVESLKDYLRARGLEPRTLGVTDYDMNAPLTAIRRLLLECNGVLTVALRRMRVVEGEVLIRRESREDEAADAVGSERVSGAWLSSPWAQIEPAMAYQLGLPVVHVRERGVRPDGLLEKGVIGLCGPEFHLDEPAMPGSYLSSPEWLTVTGKWEGYVRAVFERKGLPPDPYGIDLKHAAWR